MERRVSEQKQERPRLLSENEWTTYTHTHTHTHYSPVEFTLLHKRHKNNRQNHKEAADAHSSNVSGFRT
jgi:hypothetical protein